MFRVGPLKFLAWVCVAGSAWAVGPVRAARIVTLAPSLGEISADLLGADLSPIVGVSEFTDEPPGLKAKPSVGPYHHFDLEKVKALKPDLILATYEGNSRDQVLHLKQLGLRVVLVEGGTLKNISASFETIGTALGEIEKGKAMRQQFERGVERLRTQGAAAKKRLRIFLQLGDNPTITVGAGSYLNDVLQVIGAENVFGDQPAAYPRVSAEEVVKRNPDGILVLALGHSEKDLQAFNLMASRWRDFPDLESVKHKRIEVLSSDELLRPTIRLLEGMDRLQKTIRKWAP